MKRNNHHVSISKLICPCCKNIFPIPRIKGKHREKGHIKTVWCPYCKENRNMEEKREKDFYKNSLGELIEC